MNVYFPKWLTADIIINDIANSFGAYVARDAEDMSAIQFTFIPPEKLYMVPEEDRENFVEIYNVFADWANEKLAIDLFFQDFHYQPITEENLCYFQDKIERVIQEHNHRYSVEMKRIFAASLGAETALILPDELLNKLQNLTGIERKLGIEIEVKITWPHSEDH